MIDRFDFYINNDDDFENLERKKELLNKMEDIYQTEVELFGSSSFDIKDLENMDIEELANLASKY